MNIEEIRQKYPQYSDLSDEQLVKGIHSKHYSDMPFDQFAEQIGFAAQPQELGEPVVDESAGPDMTRPISIKPPGKVSIPGVAEAALALGSGMAADMYGNMVGGVRYATDPVSAPGVAEDVKQRFTYQPRTEAGQQIMRQYGGFMKPVAETIEKARLGDEALEAGLPEPVARFAEGIPEYGSAVLAGFGLKPGRPKQFTDPAKQKLSPSGKVTANVAGKRAVSSGWDDRLVGYVSTLDQKGKNLYRSILKRAKDYHTQFNPKGRPSDIVGDNLAKQVLYLKGVKARNGKLLDKIANQQLPKTQIDIDDFMQTYIDDVTRLGGEVSDNGRLVFGPKSLLYKQPGDQQAMVAMFDKLKTMANPTGKELHDFKKWLTKYVDYGKSPTTMKEGISGEMDTMLKGYRATVNNKIRDVYAPYAKVNDAYSDAAGSLNDLQRAVGPSTDILGKTADAGLGQKLRAVLGNNAKRIQLEDAVGEIQAMTKKYGGKFSEHDLAGQMRFINEMEKMWGPFTETSFKSEIGQAGQRVAEAPGVAQLSREGLRLTARQVSKMRKSREAQLRSMESLLSD